MAEQSTAAYWKYVGTIHAKYASFVADKQHLSRSLDELNEIAMKEVGLDQHKLRLCIDRQDDRSVRASIAQGDKLGVQGTPTIFVNGEPIIGVRPLGWLYAAIDRALKSEGLDASDRENAQISPAGK